MSYEEHPVFVPLGPDRLCAVVCAPRGEMKDLGVILISGGNVGRTHRNRMWVRLARSLAEQGFPSIRFDWHGVGDSTSATPVRFDIENPMVADLSAVGDFLKRVTSVERLVLAATCFGARTALAFAARRPEVAAVVAFPSPLLKGTRVSTRTRARQRLARRKLGERLLRSGPVKWGRAKVARGKGRRGGAVSPRAARDLAQVLRRSEVRFVYGERTKYLEELRECLAEVRARVGPAELSRLHVDLLAGLDLHRYATFAEQDIAIERALRATSEAYGVTLSPVSGD